MAWRMLVVACLLLTACSSGSNYTDKGLQETLEIQILPNSSKMFVYRLRMPEDQIPSHVRIAQSGRDKARRGGVDLSSGSYRGLLSNVNYVLSKTGYCREGFLEIDRSLSRYHIWMKGECKEGATEEDLRKFSIEKIITAQNWR